MKKLTAILLVLVMMLSIAACAPTTTETPAQNPPASTAMTHAEYLAAAEDDAVEVFGMLIAMCSSLSLI